MAWFAAAVPLVAGVLQSDETRKDANENADALREQARVSSMQTYADENAQRRQSRQLIGKQAAAMAESGAGVGGTNVNLIEQSTGNAELDALNIRYAGLLKRAGFIDSARQTKKQGYTLAGAQVLQGASSALSSGMRLRS